MDQTAFKIAPAVVQAYRLVWAERVFLLKTAAVPFAVNLATSVFIMQARPDAGLIEDFLWHLPASILMGWFLFAVTRLCFFGERLLPREAHLGPLAENLRLSIILWLLFNMLMVTLLAVLLWTADHVTPGQASVYSILGFFLVGAILWSVRFGLLHIAAAAGTGPASLKRFFFRISGPRLSFRLLGLTFLSALPMVFLFQILVSLLFAGSSDLNETQKTVIFFLAAPLSFLITAVINAAGCFAIRGMAFSKRKQP